MARADGHDNRGDTDTPFGYVYFSDGRRIVYASGHPLNPTSTGGWEYVTSAHVKSAKAYLEVMYPEHVWEVKQ